MILQTGKTDKLNKIVMTWWMHVLCSHGNVWKGYTMAPRANSRIIHVTEGDPIRALQACRGGASQLVLLRTL